MLRLYQSFFANVHGPVTLAGINWHCAGLVQLRHNNSRYFSQQLFSTPASLYMSTVHF